MEEKHLGCGKTPRLLNTAETRIRTVFDRRIECGMGVRTTDSHFCRRKSIENDNALTQMDIWLRKWGGQEDVHINAMVA